MDLRVFKSDVNKLVQDHYKLEFLLRQIEDGSLRVYTHAEGGCCRDVAYDEIVEMIEARCN